MNWPGSLEFRCWTRTGNHNIARTRYDVWFYGPDGYIWYGVTYGEDTQLCHCKRTKKKSDRLVWIDGHGYSHMPVKDGSTINEGWQG